MQAEIWRFDPEAMEEIYQCLSKSPLELSSWTDTGLAGSINTPEGGTMFTSIPYDKGWKIWVDGTAVSGVRCLMHFWAWIWNPASIRSGCPMSLRG